MATLKISDLSVGDWVRWKVDDKTYDMQVSGVTDRRIYGLHDGIEYSMLLTQICPIPITAEILEKNGWYTDGMYAFLHIDEHLHLEYYYHEHRLRKYYCGKDEWQNHAKVTDITFAAHCYSVHQLQHALRLAGVDKEINL